MSLHAAFEIRYSSDHRIHFEPTYGKLTAKVTCVLGSSGSGKSSVLRCLAGVQRPSSGRIICGDQLWFDGASGVCLSPQKRGVGFIRQAQTLFPHLNVEENLKLAATVHPRADQAAAIERLIAQFEIGQLKARRVQSLSGGEQQRVMLAQALIRRPKLLLLDEPLHALDAYLRVRTREQLRSWIRTAECQTILVTHDIDDAKAIGDELVVLERGKILQHDTVANVVQTLLRWKSSGCWGKLNALAKLGCNNRQADDLACAVKFARVALTDRPIFVE